MLAVSVFFAKLILANFLLLKFRGGQTVFPSLPRGLNYGLPRFCLDGIDINDDDA